MNLKYFKNIGKDTYEILITGEIGKDTKGSDIASEILMLNNLGAKIIRERINTMGGSVVDAYSIVSANLASNAEIHTINEGIADSAGSWILASGNKRFGYDFSTVFIHNPNYKGKSIEEIKDSPLKDTLLLMRDSIITILSNNTGKSEEEVKQTMNDNTRMSALESKDYGIIDEVLSSDKTPEIFQNMSLAEIMNVCQDFTKNTQELEITDKKDNNMKEVLNELNLSEDAKETSAVIAIQNIEKRAVDAEEISELLNTEVDGLKNQVTEKDTEINNLKEKVTVFESKEIDNAVDKSIDSGKFAEENREDLTTKCKAMGVENFNSFIEMVKIPQADAAGQIKNNGDKSKKPDEKNKALADKYQKLAEEDPAELQRIKNESPKEYAEMHKEWDPESYK